MIKPLLMLSTYAIQHGPSNTGNLRQGSYYTLNLCRGL